MTETIFVWVDMAFPNVFLKGLGKIKDSMVILRTMLKPFLFMFH